MGFEALIPFVAPILGAVVGGMLGSKKGDSQAPQVQDPMKAPASQAAQTPDASGFAKANASAAAAQGQESTLLTGLGGVDPKSLQLGKNTLLGA